MWRAAHCNPWIGIEQFPSRLAITARVLFGYKTTGTPATKRDRRVSFVLYVPEGEG
jgi:hypothetical protein